MKELADYISEKLDFENRELIQKDIVLQQILLEFSKNRFLKENLAFKGGTCLVKCYLGYYRFSEDIDFSWINQGMFKGKSEKKIRKEISDIIDKIMEILSGIAGKTGLLFEKEKGSRKFVELGGSNKFATFKLWYNNGFIKIQVNFVERFIYGINERKIKSVFYDLDRGELSFLFPEFKELFSSEIKLNAYSLEEIFIEKVRAILTRKGIKARDFVDCYLILKKMPFLKDKEEEIVEKIRFMLKYEKYSQNLKENKLDKGFDLGSEKDILLKPLDENFYKFLDGFYMFLRKIKKKAEDED